MRSPNGASIVSARTLLSAKAAPRIVGRCECAESSGWRSRAADVQMPVRGRLVAVRVRVAVDPSRAHAPETDPAQHDQQQPADHLAHALEQSGSDQPSASSAAAPSASSSA